MSRRASRRRTAQRSVPVIAVALAALTVPVTAQVAASGVVCHRLVQLELDRAEVTAAKVVEAGAFTPPTGSGVTVARPVCRVSLRASPTTASDIRFEVWLPRPADWNGRFWGLGNSGYAGSISYGRLAQGASAGYAVVSTDGGHGPGGGTAWARGQPELVADLGHRAVHLSAVHGKAVTTAYYGHAPQYAYFSGFSTGGTQGMMLAQRYPDDYDGILAGGADQDWTNLYLGLADFQFRWLADPGHHVTGAQLAALHAAALATCDADGDVIASPDRCGIEAVLATYDGAGDAPALTGPQREAVHALYTGAFDGSARLTPFGYAIGTESSWSGTHFPTTPGDVWLRDYLTAFFRDFVFDDPAWDYRTFDLARDGRETNRLLARDLNSTDPAIGAFVARGGKLLLWHGWADPLVPTGLTLDYYQRVVEFLGPDVARNAIRLFLAPGVGHGTSGSGPNQFGQFGFGDGDPAMSLAAALQHWVEDDMAPERIVASRHATPSDPGTDVVRTRPLCAWPAVARYRGTGSTDDAANFDCGGERR